MIENVEYVEMAYAGLNDGPRHYRGYMNRSYSAKRGETISVHPEDVGKLGKIANQGQLLFVLVDSNPAAEVEPDAVPSPGGETAVDATNGGEPEGGSGEPEGGGPETAVDATEGAKELAAEVGLDLALVTGTGKDGRITKTDVESHINAQDD